MAENDKWKELRKPFAKEAIGLLPKPYKKDSPKGDCKECGKWHGLPAVHLDYVGHAAVTDRLLEVDPNWSWEPMATDEHGAPVSNGGNLWIKLTVLGVTRIGVGDGANAKECISDAIRNAAMRFGVALDLWSKEELESTLVDPSLKNVRPTASKPALGSGLGKGTPTGPARYVSDKPAGTKQDPHLISGAQLVKLGAMFNEFGLKVRDERLRYVNDVISRPIESSKELTKTEASEVIDNLQADLDALGEVEGEV